MTVSSAQGFRSAALSGQEGHLVSVCVDVDARHLEALLEALATVPFPVNPEIYHDAVTRVEFPAYQRRLDEVRSALAARGFEASRLRVTEMIDRIQGRLDCGPGTDCG